MLIENELIRKFSSGFDRSPQQVNRLHEADAELLRFNGGLLAFTVDGLSEEIESGLYEDPYLIGWMAITSSMSDLAAVGASPRGVLLNLQVTSDLSEVWKGELSRGIHEACFRYQTYVLGGDTSVSANPSLACFAFGEVGNSKAMTRRGGEAGDLVFGTGPFGNGNAIALEKLIYHASGFPYKPQARVDEGLFIRDYASSCIDTSDGLFPALAQLAEINGFGYRLTEEAGQLLSPQVVELALHRKIPAWMFLAGPHGEFELVFTIPAGRCEEFIGEADAFGFHPVCVGEITKGPETTFVSEGRTFCVRMEEIANLFAESGQDPVTYFNRLIKFDAYGK